MKKMFNYLLVGTMALGLFAAQSCTKTCEAGLEGSDCKTAMNTKFAGSYAVVDSSTSGGTTTKYTYTMVVTAPSSTPGAVSISNFGGFGAGTSLSATVNGTALTIPTTTLAGVSIQNGQGTINASKLSFTYTSVDSTSTATSRAIGTK